MTWLSDSKSEDTWRIPGFIRSSRLAGGSWVVGFSRMTWSFRLSGDRRMVRFARIARSVRSVRGVKFWKLGAYPGDEGQYSSNLEKASTYTVAVEVEVVPSHMIS